MMAGGQMMGLRNLKESDRLRERSREVVLLYYFGRLFM
jgi:hypothetical protein